MVFRVASSGPLSRPGTEWAGGGHLHTKVQASGGFWAWCWSGLRAEDDERAALTKRKVIGTIENIRLPALPGLARVCVRSRTHIGLVAERQVNTRPAFKDSQLLSFGLYFPFLSPSLIPLSRPLSLFRDPNACRISAHIFVASISCSHLPLLTLRCSSSPVLVE